jgi:hypothetical protein
MPYSSGANSAPATPVLTFDAASPSPALMAGDSARATPSPGLASPVGRQSLRQSMCSSSEAGSNDAAPATVAAAVVPILLPDASYSLGAVSSSAPLVEEHFDYATIDYSNGVRVTLTQRLPAATQAFCVFADAVLPGAAYV